MTASFCTNLGIFVGQVVVNFIVPVLMVALVVERSFNALMVAALVLLAARLVTFYRNLKGIRGRLKNACEAACTCGCGQLQVSIDNMGSLHLCGKPCCCGCKGPCGRHQEHHGFCVAKGIT